ncbi:hypothetical protein BaRGS_00019712 [Batillaria attramentaria]|uniref:Uncharacterized protein n=1 Tax=Batillaria attramentaria TaxID=370345 RepID=A0ABD0KQ21_9CAEN
MQSVFVIGLTGAGAGNRILQDMAGSQSPCPRGGKLHAADGAHFMGFLASWGSALHGVSRFKGFSASWGSALHGVHHFMGFSTSWGSSLHGVPLFKGFSTSWGSSLHAVHRFMGFSTSWGSSLHGVQHFMGRGFFSSVMESIASWGFLTPCGSHAMGFATELTLLHKRTLITDSARALFPPIVVLLRKLRLEYFENNLANLNNVWPLGLTHE